MMCYDALALAVRSVIATPVTILVAGLLFNHPDVPMPFTANTGAWHQPQLVVAPQRMHV
jgi:hypothetical protein